MNTNIDKKLFQNLNRAMKGLIIYLYKKFSLNRFAKSDKIEKNIDL